MKTFLSSTSLDLADHRRAAAEALERLDQQVSRMEMFGARPDEPTAASLAEVERCDLFIGVYAHRYGFVPSHREVSVTEEEFIYARKLGKPVFCFLVDDDHPWRPRLIEGEPGRTKLTSFKQRIETTVVRERFSTPEDLAFKIATAVGRHVLDALALQVRRSLGDAGLDAQSLASGRTLSDVSTAARARLKDLLSELQKTLSRVGAEQTIPESPADAEALLALAQGLMAEEKWLEAARQFDHYARLHPENWEAAYLRGVSFANSRAGATTDLAAVRGANDAITFAPPTIEPDLRARFFAYRGAMFKRLGRLDEAEWDLLFAKARATREYEVNDIRYNLAGVYAMRGDRASLMSMIGELKRSPEYLAAVRSHVDDYFHAFKNDEEFIAAIGGI